MKFNFLILPFRAADTSQPMFVVRAKYKEGVAASQCIWLWDINVHVLLVGAVDFKKAT